MNTPQISDIFDEKMAANYDKGRAELQILKDALYLFMRGAFAPLPDKATILIVGAGTGEDILYLDKYWPDWRYVVVEPAPAMMAICREKLADAGLLHKCSFHEGFLDSLPQQGPFSGPFDGAVAALVSHFITEREPRLDFFRQIAHRLTSGGVLYSADLLVDREDTKAEALMQVWFTLLASSDIPKEQLDKMMRFEGAWLMPPADYKALIEEAGFKSPLQLYQAGLMTGWQASV